MSRRGSAVDQQGEKKGGKKGKEGGGGRNGDVESAEGEDDESQRKKTGWSVWWKIRKLRRWLRWALTLEKFHFTVIVLVVSRRLSDSISRASRTGLTHCV